MVAVAGGTVSSGTDAGVVVISGAIWRCFVGVVTEFGEEAGWHTVAARTVRVAREGVGEEKTLAGASHGDVGEAAFFFELGFVVVGAGAWEETFFHADDENDGEFETFGGVHGHEGDGITAGGFVGARHQSSVGEKLG